MNRITKMLAGVTAGIALSVTPLLASARVDPNTDDLLKLLQSGGINVYVDSNHCDGSVHGQYRFAGMRREFIVCTGDEVDANDHDTVRHETVHAIQHCVNVARGTDIFTPVMDYDRLTDMVNTHMSAEKVTWIKSIYPQQHWWVEFEAFLIADLANASELMEMFSEACMA